MCSVRVAGAVWDVGTAVFVFLHTRSAGDSTKVAEGRFVEDLVGVWGLPLSPEWLEHLSDVICLVLSHSAPVWRVCKGGRAAMGTADGGSIPSVWQEEQMQFAGG